MNLTFNYLLKCWPFLLHFKICRWSFLLSRHRNHWCIMKDSWWVSSSLHLQFRFGYTKKLLRDEGTQLVKGRSVLIWSCPCRRFCTSYTWSREDPVHQEWWTILQWKHSILRTVEGRDGLRILNTNESWGKRTGSISLTKKHLSLVIRNSWHRVATDIS